MPIQLPSDGDGHIHLQTPGVATKNESGKPTKCRVAGGVEVAGNRRVGH